MSLEKNDVLSALGFKDTALRCIPNVFVGYSESYVENLLSWNFCIVRIFATSFSPYVPLQVRKKSACSKKSTIEQYCKKWACTYNPTARMRILAIKNLVTGESIIFDFDSMNLQHKKIILDILLDTGKVLIINDAIRSLSWMSFTTQRKYTETNYRVIDPLLHVKLFFSNKVLDPSLLNEKKFLDFINMNIKGHLTPYTSWMPDFLDNSSFTYARTLLAGVEKTLRFLANEQLTISALETWLEDTLVKDAEAYVKSLIGLHLRGIYVDSAALSASLVESLALCESSMQTILSELPELLPFKNILANPDFSPDKEFRDFFIRTIQEKFQKEIDGLGKNDVQGLPIGSPWKAFIQSGHAYSYLASIRDCVFDKKIHPMYNIAAVTGRVSSRHPCILSMPAKYEKTILIPKQSCVFFKFDFSQIELRIAGALIARLLKKRDIKIQGLVTALQAGYDLHDLTALACLGVSNPMGAYSRGLRPSSEDRKKAKPVNFGLLYGMGDSSLALYSLNNFDMQLSVNDLKKFRNAWNEAYPDVALYHQYVKNLKKYNKWTVRTLALRPLVATSLTSAYNFAGQGSCVDICMRAFKRFKEENLSKYIVSFKFDAFTFEIPFKKCGLFKKKIMNCMHESAFDFLGPYDIPVGEISFSIQTSVDT